MQVCEELHIKVIFNAPTTPSFNPIEYMFNDWKHRVGQTLYNEPNKMMKIIFKEAVEINKSEVIPKYIEKSLREWKRYSDDFNENIDVYLSKMEEKEKDKPNNRGRRG